MITPLIPAKAGIQRTNINAERSGKNWVPASAGTSGYQTRPRASLQNPP
jgi:hypothetical protein